MSGSAPPSALPKMRGAGQWEGQRNGRGNSTNLAVAPPIQQPPTKRKAGRWMEFKPGKRRKDGSRLYYAKWRERQPGNKGRRWLGRVADLPPLSEVEKESYVKRNREAKKRRGRR